MQAGLDERGTNKTKINTPCCPLVKLLPSCPASPHDRPPHEGSRALSALLSLFSALVAAPTDPMLLACACACLEL